MSALRSASSLQVLFKSSTARGIGGLRMASTTDVTKYKFNHTMFRIKDPKVSLPWYENVLGMKMFNESPGGDFTNYFLAFDNGFDAAGPLTDDKRKELQSTREGILELCHNWGTEDDPNFKYHSGNDEPNRGFGHICVSVDDLQAACKRFDEMGAKFKKRPEEGRMRHIAFLLDPDGYWVEVVENKALKK